MSKLARLAVLLAVPTLVAGCARSGGSPSGAASPQAGSSGAPGASGVGVVAEVNGAPILASQLEERVGGRLARLRQEEFEIRRQALDELIAERLLDAEAARRAISLDELLRREVDSKAEAPPAERVQSIYEQNKDRFPGQSREEAIGRIREMFTRRAQAERRQAYEKELRAAARVAVRLEPPRAKVVIPAGAPSTGPAGAPVTIVEFTDYQCPYCHRAQGVMDQLLSRYAGKVRLVHLDFPLDGHPAAVPAARAARCAGEQGRFWEFHRSLMSAPGTLDDADLRGRALALKLDPAAFGSCLSSGRHDAAIHAALAQGEELGVTGTPAYFVNGRMVAGARPLEDFAEVIDAELSTGQGG